MTWYLTSSRRVLELNADQVISTWRVASNCSKSKTLNSRNEGVITQIYWNVMYGIKNRSEYLGILWNIYQLLLKKNPHSIF